MSAKWMGYFFDDTNLEGSELLLALAIADHADSDGLCFPGFASLAAKVKLGKRRVRDLMKSLEVRGYVQIVRGKGRGNRSYLQLQKGQSDAPIEEAKRGNLEHEKGQSCASVYITEPLEPSSSEKEKDKPETDHRGFTKTKPLSLPTSVDQEINLWLDATAPLLGAKSRKTIAGGARWRDAVTIAVKEQQDLTRWLNVVEKEVTRNKSSPQYLTPTTCLKNLQAMNAKGTATQWM